MNIIIAILLATTLTFAYLFLKERKKTAHKNYEIDEIHKILDDTKFELRTVRNKYIELAERPSSDESHKIVECFHSEKLKLLATRQQAAMQNSASRGNGSGYGLNNALGMLGMGSRL